MAALVLSMVVLMGASLVMVQVARANSLRAGAVTAADAAAVAAGKELLGQLQSLDYLPLDWGRVCARADEYAQRNDARLTGCEQAGIFDIRVTVQSARSVGDLGPARQPDERRASARARARVAFAVFGGGVPIGTVSAGVGDAIALAQGMGLVVTSTTGGRHAPGSYHYRGQAVDVAGSPAAMAAFYDAALARYCNITELFHDPRGGIKHNQAIGPIGGHGSHVHIALTDTGGCGEEPAGGVPGELPGPSQGGGNAFGRAPALPVGEVRLVPWEG